MSEPGPGQGVHKSEKLGSDSSRSSSRPMKLLRVSPVRQLYITSTHFLQPADPYFFVFGHRYPSQHLRVSAIRVADNFRSNNFIGCLSISFPLNPFILSGSYIHL